MYQATLVGTHKHYLVESVLSCMCFLFISLCNVVTATQSIVNFSSSLPVPYTLVSLILCFISKIRNLPVKQKLWL